MVGPTIGWDSKTAELTKSTANPHIWYKEWTFAKDEEMKIRSFGDSPKYWGLNKDWGSDNHAGMILENVINGNNDGGTTVKFSVAGKYLVMFNDLKEKYNIINID